MARARVTWPEAQVMANGRVRIPLGQAQVTTVSGQQVIEWPPDVGWELDMLPDPEPRWEPGQVVEDAEEERFVRTPAGRWRHVLGADIDPVRPLRLLT